MALDSHYRQMFIDGVKELAGAPSQSFLMRTVGFKGGLVGEAALLDAIGAPDNYKGAVKGTDYNIPLANIRTRKKHEAEKIADGATDTYANFRKMFTPHVEPHRERTLVFPYLNETGHTFNKLEKINEGLDPKGRVLPQLMRQIWYCRDQIVIAALRDEVVSRKKYAESAANNVAMPGNQQLTLKSVGKKFKLEVFSSIQQIFKDNYVMGETIYVGISTKAQKHLLNDPEAKVTNQDFVDSARYFLTGELPKIYGCVVIPHPELEDDEFYAWTENGVTWGEFRSFEQEFGESAILRFQKVAYMSEAIDCKRVDDLRVIQGRILDEAPGEGEEPVIQGSWEEMDEEEEEEEEEEDP